MHAGSRLQLPAGMRPFDADLLLSGATLFTLSLESIAAVSYSGRVLTIVEAGTGLAFLAMVVSYLPVLYQAFSRREAHISLDTMATGSAVRTYNVMLMESRRVGAGLIAGSC